MSAAAPKVVPAPPAEPAKVCVSLRDEAIAIETLTLDNTKPSTVPGMLSSTLRSGQKGGRVKYLSILFIPRLRAFQIECLHPDGKNEVVYLPEHLVIQWVAKETAS